MAGGDKLRFHRTAAGPSRGLTRPKIVLDLFLRIDRRPGEAGGSRTRAGRTAAPETGGRPEPSAAAGRKMVKAIGSDSAEGLGQLSDEELMVRYREEGAPMCSPSWSTGTSASSTATWRVTSAIPAWRRTLPEHVPAGPPQAGPLRKRPAVPPLALRDRDPPGGGLAAEGREASDGQPGSAGRRRLARGGGRQPDRPARGR